jgi:hypothetical protein
MPKLLKPAIYVVFLPAKNKSREDTPKNLFAESENKESLIFQDYLRH